MNIKNVLEYIDEKYGISPEYIFNKFPNYAVCRHKISKKWFAFLGIVDKKIINNKEIGKVEILNLKLEKELVYHFKNKIGFLPAYHMNKENWVTIILEENDPILVKKLIDDSYFLTKNK